MAHSKSAVKRIRINKRNRLRNRIYKSTINAGVYVISKSLISSIEKGSYLDMNQLFEKAFRCV